MREQDRQLKRLSNLVGILREDEDPENFKMLIYAHECGSPACVLGHYATRRDLQKTFRLWSNKAGAFTGLQSGGETVFHDGNAVQAHFGVTEKEAQDLFSSRGCGNAQNPAEAVDYIERFIKEKINERLRPATA